MNKRIPYVYFIKHIKSNMWYIGSKYGKDAHPDLFFKKYFTSSKLVKDLIESEGIQSFSYKILKTFDTPEDAINYEFKLLKRLNVPHNKNSLNLDIKLSMDLPVHVKVQCRRISNPSTGKCITWPIDRPLLEGWIEGNINCKGDPNINTRKWFHNPITGEMIHTENCPDGFLPGRGKSYISNSETLKTRNLKWYTNGNDNKLLTDYDIIPEGYYPGRILKNDIIQIYRNANMKRKGCKWITDGINSKRIMPNENLPDGWKYGRTLNRTKK